MPLAVFHKAHKTHMLCVPSSVSFCLSLILAKLLDLVKNGSAKALSQPINLSQGGLPVNFEVPRQDIHMTSCTTGCMLAALAHYCSASVKTCIALTCHCHIMLRATNPSAAQSSLHGLQELLGVSSSLTFPGICPRR